MTTYEIYYEKTAANGAMDAGVRIAPTLAEAKAAARAMAEACEPSAAMQVQVIREGCEDRVLYSIELDRLATQGVQ